MSTHAGRRSPWGPLRILDAHVHFFSHKFFSTLVAQKPGLTLETAQQQLGWELPPENPDLLAARWIEELDHHGVQSAAIIASIPGDEASVLTAAAHHPDRLIPYAMVNPRATWSAEALANVKVGRRQANQFIAAVKRLVRIRVVINSKAGYAAQIYIS